MNIPKIDIFRWIDPEYHPRLPKVEIHVDGVPIKRVKGYTLTEAAKQLPELTISLHGDVTTHEHAPAQADTVAFAQFDGPDVVLSIPRMDTESFHRFAESTKRLVESADRLVTLTDCAKKGKLDG